MKCCNNSAILSGSHGQSTILFGEGKLSQEGVDQPKTWSVQITQWVHMYVFRILLVRRYM